MGEGNYRGISMLSVPGKKCIGEFFQRLIEVTEGKVSKEHGGLRKEMAMWSRQWQLNL